MNKQTQAEMFKRLNKASMLRQKCEKHERKVKQLLNLLVGVVIVSIAMAIISSNILADTSFIKEIQLALITKLLPIIPYVALGFMSISLVWLVIAFLKIFDVELETSKARKQEGLLVRKLYKVLALNSNGNYNFVIEEE